MKRITIGIPKALLYYQYKDLWTRFFENLGCDIVISPNTTKETIEIGKKYVLDEACLSMKIYMGHVYYLLDKCDYVLTYRIASLNKNERICTNFTALYDLVKNSFDKRLIYFNIDKKKLEDEEFAFISMGLSLGLSYRKVRRAYVDAKNYDNLMKERAISHQRMLLGTSKKIKILLAGHPYNLYDNLIGKEVKDFLDRMDVDVLYSDLYDKKYVDVDSKKISPKSYFTHNKEIMGSISSLESEVDGIILITTFPCGPDSLCNEMIARYVSIPLITLTFDELNSDTGLITRLESFLDIIEERKKSYER